MTANVKAASLPGGDRPALAPPARPSPPAGDAAKPKPVRTAAVSTPQRATLYDEDPVDKNGKSYAGSVVWRTQTASPGPGLRPEPAAAADIEIPGRYMTVTLALRRNADQTLPASHTIEIKLDLPADSPSGAVADVPGILLKTAEQARGMPLVAKSAKVQRGFFIAGLSSVPDDMQRNIKLLRERAWIDIPIVHESGRRGILAIEKGDPGRRALDEVLAR